MRFVWEEVKEPEHFCMIWQKGLPLKKILSLGLNVLQFLPYRRMLKYNQWLLDQVRMFMKDRDANDEFLKIYWGYKITYLFLALLVLCFLAFFTAAFDPVFWCFCVFILLMVFFLPDYELKKAQKKRILSIELEFPEFLTKLILLLSAGMTSQRAMQKIVHDRKRVTPLYYEFGRLFCEMEAGKSVFAAFESLAGRCKNPEITRFVTLMLQNMRKGNKELVPILQLQAQDCWEKRKHKARRLGEEASTKLLLPMMLMFIAIILIVMTPAILAMRGI